MNSEFRKLAAAFRGCMSQAEFKTLCENAGFAAINAIDAGLIPPCIEGYKLPETYSIDPRRGDYFELAWITFAAVWPAKYPSELPVNPNATKGSVIDAKHVRKVRGKWVAATSKTGERSEIWAGNSGPWEARRHGYAAICDWLAGKTLETADPDTQILERARRMRNQKIKWPQIIEELQVDSTPQAFALRVTRYCGDNDLDLWVDNSKKKKSD